MQKIQCIPFNNHHIDLNSILEFAVLGGHMQVKFGKK